MRGVCGPIITHTNYEKSDIVVELRHTAVAEAEFRGAERKLRQDRSAAVSVREDPKNLSMSVTQILVVDDFLPWQRFVSLMFESEPDLRIISVASDGLEALQKAQELQPGVIFDGRQPARHEWF
jgi:hypothetical protein